MSSGPGGINKAAVAVVVVALAVIVGSFLMRPDGSDQAVDDSRPETSQSPTVAPSATPSPEPVADESAGSPALAGQTSFPGLGTQPGMGGAGMTDSLPKHTLTVRLTAEGPALGSVAYVIPTSRGHESGKTFVKARTWSLTTTVYGNPKYAAVFGQGDYRGNRVSCVVTVDGKVTDRRSTEGPYGAMWCVG